MRLNKYIDPENLPQKNVEETKNALLSILKDPKYADKTRIITYGLKVLYCHKYNKEIKNGDYEKAMKSIEESIKYSSCDEEKQQIILLKGITKLVSGENEMNNQKTKLLEDY